jgi:hypothetical protein
MIKRILFLIIYVACLPAGFLATIIAILVGVISPILWVIIGDEEKVGDMIFDGPVQYWLINLPYVIYDKYIDKKQV